MDSIKIKAKNNWDFTLYQVNQEEIISVVFFNSMFDFSRSFKLNEIERNFDFEKLKELSEQIRNNYDLFKDREVIPAIISESPT
jgi:hypothetical protein